MLLTDLDRLLIQETLEEIETTPVPYDPGPIGCPMALLGLFVLIVPPVLSRVIDVPRVVGIGAGLVGAAVLVLGVILAVTAGGHARGAVHSAAEAALRQLESGDEDREVLLRAATLLLTHAYVTSGPTMSSTFERPEAEKRLSDRLELVRAVELHMLEREQIDPVFTTGDREDETESTEEGS